MNQHYDVIVVGVGSMGAATCYHLARRGVKVLGLEQFNIPHSGGSHHGGSRLIRQAYFEHPDYVKLLQAVYPQWQALEEETRETLFHRVGALYMGQPNCELVSGSQRAAETYQVPYEQFSAAEVRDRFPAFSCPDEWVGFYEPHAGYLRPEACVSALARQAMLAGADLRAQTKVVAWSRGRSSVQVRTTHEIFTAERLVICGGAWAGSLLADLDVSMSVTRQVVAWLWPPNLPPFQPGAMPCWAIDPEPAGQYRGIYYGFPLSLDPPGLKLGWHAPGIESDPDQVDRQIHAADLEWLPDFVGSYMPALNCHPSHASGSGRIGGSVGDRRPPLLGAATCLYTYSPDGHFMVDRHPEHASVYFAAGFSGHGFKFAPIIGQALADLCQQGSTSLPIDFLSLSRFQRGKE